MYLLSYLLALVFVSCVHVYEVYVYSWEPQIALINNVYASVSILSSKNRPLSLSVHTSVYTSAHLNV